MPVLSVHSLLLTTLGTAVASWAVFPAWRRWCLKHRWVDDPGHRKIHVAPTPLAGGWSVLTGLLIAVGVAFLVFPHVSSKAPSLPLPTLLIAAVALFALGAWDDRVEIPPALKFTGQTLVTAGVVFLTGLRLPLPIESPALLATLTLLWVLTVINAFNLSDNMNGLCSGLAAIAAGLVALRSVHHQPDVALLGGVVAGAFAGFIPWNYPRASAFLGDAGSHLAGFLVGILTVATRPEGNPATPSFHGFLPAILIVAVPLIDVAQVFVHRTVHGRPFWVGDTNHLSHRLSRTALGRPGAVAALWMAALWIGALSWKV